MVAAQRATLHAAPAIVQQSALIVMWVFVSMAPDARHALLPTAPNAMSWTYALTALMETYSIPSTTAVFISLPMLRSTPLTHSMELSLSRDVITDITSILPHVDALNALTVVPVAIVRLSARDVMPMRTPMLLAHAKLVIQQLNTALIAIFVVLLSGAMPALKGKDL
jgi:hypothetical protein